MKSKYLDRFDPFCALSLFLPTGMLDYFDLVNGISQDTCFILYYYKKPLTSSYAPISVRVKIPGVFYVLPGKGG